MSLGLPGHLAPHSESRAFARASHVIAASCLAAAAIVVLLLQQVTPGVTLWPTLLALVPVAAALWLLEIHRSLFYTVTYLLVGAASLYWFVLVGTLQFPERPETNAFVFSMAKIALLFVGGAGIGVRRLAVWSAIGFVLGETVTVLAALQTGAGIRFDFAVTGSLLVLISILTTVGISRRRVADAQPSLHRAARDEHLSDIRLRLETRAAAMMHDTILNHLAAVSAAGEGPLRADLRDRITRDLEVLVGEEWLVDGDHDFGDGAHSGVEHPGWLGSRLFRSIDEARDLGLTVALSGDRSAVTRLAPSAHTAAALAVKQCLVNVLKHSGTDVAEVVVYGSDSEVSIMVIDAGRGFSERETSVDRLGLRQSVRRRIEAIDGSVQVWSTPGMGTSVLMRVPTQRPSAAPEVAP
jgi:signal transduction histidine kinase